MAQSFITDRFHHPPTGSPPSDQPLSADGNSSAMNVRECVNKTVQIGGTFTATVQLQGTIDGTTWQNVGSSVSAAAVIEVSPAYAQLRVVISGYADGAVIATFAGFLTRVAN